MASTNNNAPNRANYVGRYVCVLDFEATCDDDRSFRPSEIIEFPSVMCRYERDEKGQIVLTKLSQFQRYVKPVVHPKLTPFCTRLTGITQETVDRGVPFLDALKEHKNWLMKQISTTEEASLESILFVTCGDWDLKTMIHIQCSLVNVAVPSYFKTWCNLKQDFMRHYNLPKQLDMGGMLQHMGLTLEGRHHSGIDDCNNIARIAMKLATEGRLLDATWTGSPPPRGGNNRGGNSSPKNNNNSMVAYKPTSQQPRSQRAPNINDPNAFPALGASNKKR